MTLDETSKDRDQFTVGNAPHRFAALLQRRRFRAPFGSLEAALILPIFGFATGKRGGAPRRTRTAAHGLGITSSTFVQVPLWLPAGKNDEANLRESQEILADCATFAPPVPARVPSMDSFGPAD